jgi:uridine phosphorylase
LFRLWPAAAGALHRLEAILHGGEAFFKLVQLRPDLSSGLEATAREGFASLLPKASNLGPGFLSAACQLVARALPALGDLADDLARALACLAGGRSGRRKGPLDGGAQRIGDSAVVAFETCFRLLVCHPLSLRFRARLNVGGMRAYLDPTAPIAPDAVLTDEPKGAMDLAVAACDSPRMSNLSHGLWGYHGTTSDGAELTVQSLGIGGPSAAAVMSDLAGLGVRRAIRIGSCNSLRGSLRAGSSLLATSFEPEDGAGSALAKGRRLRPDPGLTEALSRALPESPGGAVRSTDLASLDGADGGVALAQDLSSAAFAAAAARDGVAYACALVVAGDATGKELGQEALEEALIRLGMRAVAALGAVAQASGS